MVAACRRLAPLWLLAFVLVFTRTGAQLVVTPLLGARHLGLRSQEIGLILTLSGVGALVGLYPAGWLTDCFGWKSTLLPGGVGTAVGLVLLGVSGTTVLFAGAAVLLGTANGFAGPATAAYLAGRVAEAERALAASQYRMVGDLGTMLAPPFFGWAADRRDVGMVLALAAALLLAVLAVFAWEAGLRQALSRVRTMQAGTGA